MRPQIVTILTFVLLALSNSAMFAQKSGANPPPPPQRTPVELPLDNGILLLVIAGIVYGVYAIVMKNKARNILD